MKNINNADYWTYFVDFISSEFDAGIMDMVIKPNRFISFDNGIYTLLAPSGTIKKLLNNQFKNKLEIFLRSDSGQQVHLRVLIESDLNIQSKQTFSESKLIKVSNPMHDVLVKYENIFTPNDIFRFDNFVIGSSNKLSFNAAQSFASGENDAHNPLFIWGCSGLGKTHLISAIANDMIVQGKKVCYMQANEFVQHYMSSLGHISQTNGPNNIDEFVSILNNVDMLVIDDVQNFNGKTGSADTFFNIFNHLVKNGKKVVLASDQPPRMLNGIPERLITRFNQGLTLKVLKPETELAVAFLKQKIKEVFIENDELMVTDEVFEFLGISFGDDFRTLSGVVNKLGFLVVNEPANLIDKRYIEKYLIGDVITKTKIQGGKIKEIICDLYQISDKDQLVGSGRKTNIAEGRHLAIWFFRRYLGDLSFKAIGNEFGGRHHSTIMSSCELIEKKIKKDTEFKKLVDKVIKKIGF